MLLTLALTAYFAASPDTLVVKRGDTYEPGVAASWVAGNASVVFTLRADANPDAIAQTLRERLFNATVSVDGRKLIISGISPPALLEQVATLSLSGQADPLGELAALGGVLSGEGPEAGGSIRASRPTPHDPSHRFHATVETVKPATFPHATLVLRVTRAAKEGPHSKLLAGDKITGTVVFAHDEGHIDFTDPTTQRNVGAYYLRSGDAVLVHSVRTDKGVYFDFVEREK